jgi:hypothetical protein
VAEHAFNVATSREKKVEKERSRNDRQESNMEATLGVLAALARGYAFALVL